MGSIKMDLTVTHCGDKNLIQNVIQWFYNNKEECD
jgi:hypothetical protein